MPLERYQSIIDRQMFGPLPPDFDPTKAPSEVKGGSSRNREDKELTKEQEKLKSSVRFSLINVEANGDVKVGFTDNSDPKLPLHYYLKVGEEKDGWIVKEADAEEATMTIAKGEVEVFLRLGGDSSKSADATRANSPADTPTRRTLGSRRHQRQVEGFAELRKKMEEDRIKREEEEKIKEEARKEEAAANRAQLEALATELRQTREANKQKSDESKEENKEDKEEKTE